MTFRRRIRLDPSQVRDLRGRSAWGGARSGRGIALAGGGGLAGAIVLVIFVLLGGDLGSDPSGAGTFQYIDGADQAELSTDCQTGADANGRDDCAIVGFVNSVQSYWADAFGASDRTYTPATTYLFSGAVSTGCGVATAQVGPFYCPPDRSVYLDISFFDDLRSTLGARGGPFAEAYVVAHEYGHHVQALLGELDDVSRDRGSGGAAVRQELQADCLAGTWAGHAADTGFLVPPTQAEVADALDAAAAVGDDRIQRRTTGEVDPDTWTHGSAEQRRSWFIVGYQGGDPGGCDTSSAA
jgi:uncharacterized protein